MDMQSKKVTRIYRYDTIDSTNEEAKRLVRQGAPGGSVVLAEAQSRGKGRLGRSFYSPADRGIYMSIILRSSACGNGDILAQLSRSLGKLSVTAAAAVSACRGIEKTCGISCDIKWVNDIYLSGRKICGILSEAGQSPGSRSIDFIVVGIGVNCVGLPEEFPPELRERVGTLSEAAPTAFEADGLTGRAGRERLALAIAEELLTCVSAEAGEDGAEGLLAEYKGRSLLLGRQINIYKNAAGGMGAGLDKDGNPIPGIAARAVDIDESGGLLVEYPDGSRGVLKDGEVSVRSSQQ